MSKFLVTTRNVGNIMMAFDNLPDAVTYSQEMIREGTAVRIVNTHNQQDKENNVKKFVIAGTGTRQLIKEPKEYRHKVLGYLVQLLEGAKEKHGAENVLVISGMAEGFDEALARAAIIAGVPFTAAVPNKGYLEYYWGKNSQLGSSRLGHGLELLNKAAEVHYVCKSPASQMPKYKNEDGSDKWGTANFERNEWMVDRADVVWAYNPNNSSGTNHCIAYAKEQHVPVFHIIVPKDDVKNETPNNPEEGPNMTTPVPSAIKKLEKLSQEEIDWITQRLEGKILDHLEEDVSAYARGRMRTWIPFYAPLDTQKDASQPFKPGVLDDEIWQWIVDLCAKHGFKAEVALISKAGNITPHRDTTYAAEWAIGINLGACSWSIASGRNDAKPNYTMALKGGEVFMFNTKHTHAVANAAPDRWAINVWAIADGPKAREYKVQERLDALYSKHPEIKEFVDSHKPSSNQTPTMEEAMKQPKVHNKHHKTASSDAVYIGRGSKWGNPFVIGEDGSREDVIVKYEKYILGNAELLSCLPELKGKDVVCYCAPQACHGDILIRLANDQQEEAMNAEQPQNNDPVNETDDRKETKVSGKPISVDKWKTDMGLSVELKRSDGDYQKEAGRSWFAVVEGKIIYPKKVDGVIDELTARIWLSRNGLCTMPEIKTPKVKPTEKKEETMQVTGTVMLNEMQAKAFDLVVNGTGNVLLTGNAGTGKSFLTNLIVETMQAAGKQVVVCATTGIAATHINGGTYHSLLRIMPIHDIDKDGYNEVSFEMKVEKTVNDIVGNRDAMGRLKNVDLIIVDEVSMMHKVDFGRIDHAFRRIFNSALPFGGKRFLFVGDFLQIEPVETNRKKVGPFFAYNTKAWANAEIEIVQLTKIVRQQDAFFAAFLNNVRQAIMSEATKRVLMERITASYEGVEGLIYFMPTNKEVDEINNRMLEEIADAEQVYKAQDMTYPWQPETYWDKNCLAPKVLKLKVGAQVINLKNNSENMLVNGDVGVVTRLASTYVMVHWYRLNQEIAMKPVSFHQGDEHRSSRHQIPLKPAWALSIHKSQGMTLDKVCISFGSAFANGQVYVALSRVRSIDGLFISDANFDKIKADPSALAFYGLTGNVSGAEAEAVCHIANMDNDDPDDGGSQHAIVDPNPNNNGGSDATTPTPQEENNVDTLKETEQKLIEELNKIVQKDKEKRMKRLEKMEGSSMWVELLVEDKAYDLVGGYGTLSRIITNDPAYWVKMLDVEVIEKIEMGGYHYALLDHLFSAESVCAQITAFKHPEKTADGEEIQQKVAVRRATKPENVIFGFADFDAEYLIRVKGHSSTKYSTMQEYNLTIGNSSKMIKRLVELFKKSPGYRIHTGTNRFKIKIVTHAEMLAAFPELQILEKAGKLGDGINIGAIKTAKYIYRGSKHLSKAQKGRILHGIDTGEYMNHTVRILTNINGVAGLIKGNMLLGDLDAINKKFREAGIIGANEEYEIFTTPDNFKEEFGTDGTFELATLDLHHGPGPVKTNDQMLAQYSDIDGMCRPDELMDAFEKYLNKAYLNMTEGKDIQYLEKIQADRPDDETERIAQIRGSKITTVVNKMAATLNELNLPLSVSQTMMLQRANLVMKMFLAEESANGRRLGVGEAWQAPSKAKKSFVFMPWAYWAYILPKEIISLAGYEVDLTGDTYMEAEYHPETGTIMVPGALYDEIMARLGGGDGDDRVMVHIRKMIMKDGTVRFVAVLIRTPNDWSEYWIIDVNVDNYGPVFVADDLDVDLPTIYEEQFDKFNVTSVCGQLPSAVNGSNRPTPAIWDWESTRYNYTVWPYVGTKVGGQVKTKMLQYGTRNAPFATLPCANEDMIDAIQQCKGDAADMQVLNDWSIGAIADLLLTENLDAYWWYSRNMYGTVKMLKATGVIQKGREISHLSPSNSPLVRDLMLPREVAVRQTHARMLEWLNNNIIEIDELQVCITAQTADTYKSFVSNLNKKFNGTIGMDKKQRSAHFEKAAQEVMDELNAYKENNTEEEFYRHILRLVRMSYLMKKNSLDKNWQQNNSRNNYDRWLYTAVSNAEIIPTDYFYQAMIWFREVFKKKQ